MPTTPNVGLFVVDPADTTTKVLDWVRAMGSTDPTSNMMLLDAALKNLETNDVPIVAGSGENSVVIGDGYAQGAHSVAGGTADFDLIKNLTNNQVSADDLEPASASGDMSIAYGPNAKAITTGSTALGTASVAGCKGFYWHKIDFDSRAITLSAEQKPHYVENGTVFNEEPVWNEEVDGAILAQWEPGDLINITEVTSHQTIKAVIESVDPSGVITVAEPGIPFVNQTSSDLINARILEVGVENFDFQDCAVCNPSRPEAGVVEYGVGAYANGLNCKASGLYSYACGRDNIAAGNSAFVEGRGNIAGYSAHAEGRDTTASGNSSHTEGSKTTASGDCSHAEGSQTNASNYQAHAEGGETTASGNSSHAEGYKTTASGYGSHAEGIGAEASQSASHAEGFNAKARGLYSHAEGKETFAYGEASHVEGNKSQANGSYSHAEGNTTTTKEATYAHSEGYDNTASGYGSHVEGGHNKATKTCAHAEGIYTEANGSASHAEGNTNYADGDNSHAEGYKTLASGGSSHVEGIGTVASQNAQHVQGKYNVINNPQDGDIPQYAHIVGNGTSEDNRSNAHTLDWQGNAWFAGDISLGNERSKVAKIQAAEYTGTGVYGSINAKSISFEFIPKVVIIKMKRTSLAGYHNHEGFEYDESSKDVIMTGMDDTQMIAFYGESYARSTVSIGGTFCQIHHTILDWSSDKTLRFYSDQSVTAHLNRRGGIYQVLAIG